MAEAMKVVKCILIMVESKIKFEKNDCECIFVVVAQVDGLIRVVVLLLLLLWLLLSDRCWRLQAIFLYLLRFALPLSLAITNTATFRIEKKVCLIWETPVLGM